MALSHDFREKVIILGLTAVITGLLIPYILKSVEQNRVWVPETLAGDFRKFWPVPRMVTPGPG